MKIVKIKKIEIKNFMGFAESEKTFEQRDELVGESGSGKSCYMQALRFVFNLPTCDYKPQTENKVLIPDLETYVKVIFMVDELEYFVERVGTQKWKTDKETGEKIYNGYDASNFNFDGTPCKSNEIEKKLSELLNIEIKYLPLVLIPNYFNNEYDWKSRRIILFNKCGVDDITEQLKHDERYILIANELLKGKDTNEIGKILNSEKLSIGKQRAEIETTIKVRTDDLTNANKYDFDGIEKELLEISTKIDRLLKSNNKSNKNELVNDKLKEINTLQCKINKLRQDDMIEEQTRNRNIDNLENKCRDLVYQIKRLENNDFANRIENAKISITEIESRLFNGETSCLFCKQELPKEDIDKIVKEFENNKNSQIESKNKDILSYEQQLEDTIAQIKSLKAQYKDFKDELDKLQARKSLLNTEQITALENDIDKINLEIENIKIVDVKNEVDDKVAELKEKQKELTMQLAYKNEVERLNYELEKLNNKAIDLTDIESTNIKKRKQLADYEMEVIKLANEKINSKFSDGLKFRLFKKLTANADKDYDLDCEVEYNGVSYDNLSCGQKNQADLLTCLGLQEMFDINLPIFKDNSQDNTYELKTNRQLIDLITMKGREVNGVRIKTAYCKIIENLNKEK